ncbi:MAG: translation factor SUA5, partial [Clostridia bacterium]|nr:translation factor SUA5 [Clostridia bacterium]
PAVTHQLAEGQEAASPGMKYKHYSPEADVILIKGTTAQYAAFVNARAAAQVYAMCFNQDAGLLQVPVVPYGDADEPETQAHLLFECLRKLDEMGAKTVYAHCPAETGVGLAVYNRILRAAGFEVIDCTEDAV